MSGWPPARVSIEITEHAPVDDYDALLAAFAPLRKMGVRLSIDDAGVGYSSLRQIVKPTPDVIKLDMSLTRNVDKDPALRSLARALIGFGREVGAIIIAEGIETTEEMATLQELRVYGGQGYHLGRPGRILSDCLIKHDCRQSA
ncbi:EAL domain-containing protein [Ahrensia sp. R2A130]|uniref:EAL domain-containing protein n=1 Tax=Ahrensia sp. R2A130 TaxID=744979 RepID=UPI0001E0F84D|nr:EAL domain-containing protein [Ahrensia sp. R2A130]EFL89924.1 EAL domain-containing protein [Ahrensia sp. R2A130]